MIPKMSNIILSYEKAIAWIKNNTIPEQGVIISSKKLMPYPEVTGYLIPTLLEVGEQGLAKQYAEFLVDLQRPNGSFAAPDGKEYVFDTGMALQGLIRASQYWDKYKPFAINALVYVICSIEENGRIPCVFPGVMEHINVMVLPTLVEACNILDRPEYLKTVQSSLLYYKNTPAVLNLDCLSHFLAYIIDGFIEMGELDFVRPTVERVFFSQKKNGGIPAFPKVDWICSVGTAQFAIIGYKLGMDREADRAINYLCKIQNPSGGFYGSHGWMRSYFPNEEISWANKFFIDGINLKREVSFKMSVEGFPSKVSSDDARLKAIFTFLGNLKDKKILDAGCGKGRFAEKIKESFSSCEVHGVDICADFLKEAPESLIKRKGNITNLPYASGSFDAVFCVEALEHTIRIEKAIEELCRVTKELGRVIIIDKNIEKMGRLKIVDFEQWFDKKRVRNIMENYLQDVHIEEIGYDNHAADGLFLLWSGVKRQESLTSRQWSDGILGKPFLLDLSSRIRGNSFPPWARYLLRYSSQGDSLLELGSGSGELSAILSIYSRVSFLLDYSEKNMKYAKALFEELRIKGTFICQDLSAGISMKADSVDWVFSSGLLEHFFEETILNILKESVRICRKGVMSLVPNANSIFYRIAKSKEERQGNWIYGREIPRYTMQDFYKKAGLKNIKEFSVGTFHALNFFETGKKEARDFFSELNAEEISRLNQGYLLFTYGEK